MFLSEECGQTVKEEALLLLNVCKGKGFIGGDE